MYCIFVYVIDGISVSTFQTYSFGRTALIGEVIACGQEVLLQHQLSCHQSPRLFAQLWFASLKCPIPALCFCLLVSWLLLTRNNLLKVDPHCGKLKRGKN